MKINNETKTQNEVIKTVENANPKVVTIVQNPNNIKEARVYVDDTRFIQWFNIEANFKEQLKLFNKLSVMFEIVIVMEHEEWDNAENWTTSFIEFEFLKWNVEADKWWDSETRRGKAITERWENIWE
ncbi:MAG: hypothetical protein IJI42_05545 [Methanobrevibacter sp.]|nr:hypothetical protein [Methanobrevibacter sp.]MBQ6350376.1 hypothetical protein [Methanobrevibacter sp.]